MELTNPKRKTFNSSETTFYPYYAGYSPEFVEDVINYTSVRKGSIIMDPWNGSGTTTTVSMNLGLNCVGFDINPVMVLVAKSRCLDQHIQKSLISIGREIIDKANNLSSKSCIEPLETWFKKESALLFRNLERAVRLILIDNEKERFPYYMNMDLISSLAAFYYVALFRTLRDELKIFKTTNPTWIKKPKKTEDLLFVDSKGIYLNFLSHITKMSLLLSKMDSHIPVIDIQKASSINIPIDSETIDSVITSPPYCTRIDYAIATLPELALIGCSLKNDVKQLRHKMIGSPVIDKITPERQNEWGANCIGFLKQVEDHTSVSSSTYYLKNYLQYFDLMFKSLSEINRTLKKRGLCTLVIQESYYKNVFLDLPNVIREMTKCFSWKLVNCYKFDIKNSMVDVNKKVKKYRTENDAKECVLIFEK